jgi:hypothetical protein
MLRLQPTIGIGERMAAKNRLPRNHRIEMKRFDSRGNECTVLRRIAGLNKIGHG